MKKDQLVKKLHCGLKYLNISKGDNDGTFNLKNLEKSKNPEWPNIIQFLAQSGITTLNVSFRDINHRALEPYSMGIGSNPVSPCANLKILNLQHNPITKDGAKSLSVALKANTSIEFIDLS